jgi:hypothetical protein
MASLDFLAAGVQDDTDWTRPSGRTAEPNPFADKLAESWEQRTDVNGKPRGSSKSVAVQTYEQLKMVRNALNRAGGESEVYGVGLAYFGPKFYMTQDNERVSPADVENYDADDLVSNDDGEPIEFRDMLDPIKKEDDWNKIGSSDVLIKFRAQVKRKLQDVQPSA